MKHRINIRGVLIPNDYKWFYDFFEEDSTCPADVQKILDIIEEGDEIEVYINSPGGSVTAGMAIYDTMQYIKCDVSTIYTVFVSGSTFCETTK